MLEEIESCRKCGNVFDISYAKDRQRPRYKGDTEGETEIQCPCCKIWSTKV